MIENTYGPDYNRYPSGTTTERGRNVNRIQPAIDRLIAPASGLTRATTRDGQPISYNRAPAADLAPWISRFYFSRIAVPADHKLDCGLFNDTTYVRIQHGGTWRAETARGAIESDSGVLVFGPHSKRMKVQVTGSVLSFGFGLCPGACHVLANVLMSDIVDRAVPCEDLGGRSEPWNAVAARAADAGSNPEDAFRDLEDLLRKHVARLGARLPEPVSQQFERAAFVDPTIAVSDFARDHGIEQRRLERMVKRDFGFTPKAVLRRARALDFASLLRGVADEAEADSLALRYYDQSHLIREFTALFGMSPRQFAHLPQPLMTSALENRQARRLEMLDRIAPGAIRPWE
ncbi:AraC family transcriptional regulator [Novosphingobium sp.]|uniref:helix-turn-helix domain-containing protein n=1 Tax=Novosphingobium sp. TaxID=1874826 RepID=UPI0025F6888A|nr:AraC family transcriptional regulator [Novosphingobium sp.]